MTVFRSASGRQVNAAINILRVCLGTLVETVQADFSQVDAVYEAQVPLPLGSGCLD